jgi:NAD(P)-dependent dehydrogenase (short-subunit alcohol dehydrogenase family)
MSFENMKVVVTGGAKGIGGACVKAFTEEGAKVCILDIDQAGQEFADTLGDNTFFIQCDVSKENEVKIAFQEIEKRLGTVEILVNNAGIQRYSTVTETSEEEWDLVMNVNLKSAFLCSKYAIPMMVNNKKGCVINVASVQSFISQKNVAPYTTSKTALLGLTRSIAVDYAPNIRSVAVCPGTVDTPMFRNSIQESPNPDEVLEECNEMHLVKRICSSEEVGELITYLASDKAGFITGQAIRIDGGLGITIAGSKRD